MSKTFVIVLFITSSIILFLPLFLEQQTQIVIFTDLIYAVIYLFLFSFIFPYAISYFAVKKNGRSKFIEYTKWAFISFNILTIFCYLLWGFSHMTLNIG